MKPDCYYFKQFFEDKPPFCNRYGCMACDTCKSYISKVDAERNIKEYVNKQINKQINEYVNEYVNKQIFNECDK